MILTAIGTVHGKRQTRAPNPAIPKDRGEYESVVVKPGDPFDTADLGISEKEAEGLIGRGAAKRKTVEVAVDQLGAAALLPRSSAPATRDVDRELGGGDSPLEQFRDQSGEQGAGAARDYSTMDNAELVAEAKSRGITLPKAAKQRTNAAIIKVLQAADRA